MIEFVIAYDEGDIALGSYFQKCRDQLVSVIQGIPLVCTTNELSSHRCTRVYLDVYLGHLKDVPFIVSAFTHGNPNQLVVNGGRFVDSDEDNTFFQHSLFYTNSCSSGRILGPSLISQNCKVFIGFNQDVDALLGDPYEDLSVRCDNYGIIAFLTQDITAFEAYEQMLSNYTREIQSLKDANDVLRAGILITARESLVYHGDKNVTRSDFE
jgi:hypothetical protein